MSSSQSNQQMYLNSPLYLEQNANSYGSYITEGDFDYTFLINLSLISESTISGDITSIFENAAFIQNSLNADDVDINLALNTSLTYPAWGTTVNNQSFVTLASGLSTLGFSTLTPTLNQSIGDRLLEVVAHKLFGNGQARAAIDNDLEFYTHDAVIWDHLSTALSTQKLANDVFNQYVASGRYGSQANTAASTDTNYNGNDVNRWVNFNFKDLTFDYPMFLTGSLGLNDTMTASERSQLNNGPVVGGSQLNSGKYNVPILIRFHA